MAEPGDLETYEVEEEREETVDTAEHVLCGECEPEAYLCGTPRSPAEEEVIKPMGALFTLTPCPVCFGAEHLTCNSCGKTIRVHLS